MYKVRFVTVREVKHYPEGPIGPYVIETEDGRVVRDYLENPRDIADALNRLREEA